MNIPNRMREAAEIIEDDWCAGTRPRHTIVPQLRADADTIERVIVSMEPFARTAEVAEWLAALKGKPERKNGMSELTQVEKFAERIKRGFGGATLEREMLAWMQYQERWIADLQSAAAPDTHVAVRRMTEAEAEKSFEHAWDYLGIGERYFENKKVWLAALRWAGVIIKEGE